jgi:hypothetical protein
MYHHWFWWQFEVGCTGRFHINSTTRLHANYMWPERLYMTA